MWAGAPCGDQLVANSPRERQVSESSVQMSELAPDSERDSAEAVVVDGTPSQDETSRITASFAVASLIGLPATSWSTLC
jgi:hypothetical protein